MKKYTKPAATTVATGTVLASGKAGTVLASGKAGTVLANGR